MSGAYIPIINRVYIHRDIMQVYKLFTLSQVGYECRGDMGMSK